MLYVVLFTSNLFTDNLMPFKLWLSPDVRNSLGLRRNFTSHSLPADSQRAESFSAGGSNAVFISNSVSRFRGLGISETPTKTLYF